MVSSNGVLLPRIVNQEKAERAKNRLIRPESEVCSSAARLTASASQAFEAVARRDEDVAARLWNLSIQDTLQTTLS